MINLPGYEINEQLFKSFNTIIFKGKSYSDKTDVIIKVLNSEYPSTETLDNFRREYFIAERLSGDKIIKASKLENFNNGLAIVMEDFGGKSLADVLRTNKLDIKEKLMLSIDIVDALMQIHEQKVIHKDINPSNIIINTKTKQVKIIDFGISTNLKMEKPQNSSFIEGTVQYISPEQTGKVNRIIDYRSDFYSLGITLYEIFTGVLPFDGDELEIVYGHIAKMPKEPRILDKRIPYAISDIIVRLIEKNAEDRYQSLSGLKYDLLYCLENLKSEEKLINFKIAQKDFLNRFQIPQKLYGREKELEDLRKTFEDVETTKLRLLLVSGFSGIGKTSLIREMNKVIINQGGYFISGKFNRLQCNIPYSAATFALRELIRNIISDSKNIEVWKNRLIEALGSNGKIVMDFIPELKEIIGEQPEVPKLNPVEEKNRFQMVFCNFIKVFAKKEHPLVMFLDDLQWCDFPTTDFLNYILTSMEVENFVIIGAYRDNEVSEGHPLMLMLNQVKNIPDGSDFLKQIYLEPLTEQTVNQMVVDTLNCHNTDTCALTSCLYRKTKGNPFFTIQLLNSLYEKGLFKLDEKEFCWKWDMEEMNEVEISDNVVEFMIQTLNLLPADSLEIIKKASCIGNTFDIGTLYDLCGEIKSISDALWTIIDKDLIVPLNINYRLLHMPKEESIKPDMEIKFRFSHDRIQQAAYSMISDADKLLIHQKIGKLLLDLYTDHNNLEDNIFEVINHLNIAKDLVQKKDERLKLMELNYSAGKKAKGNIAYEIANNYFKVGKTLLTEEEWKEYPSKLFELSYNLAESNYLAANFEEAIELCEDLFKVASDNIDKASVYSLKAKIIEFKGDKKEMVVQEVSKGLKLLDVDLPIEASEIERKLSEGINKMVEYIGNSSIENLVNLPVMTDRKKIMTMKMFFQLQATAYQYNPSLSFLIQVIVFDMVLNYGVTEVTCKNFLECGIMLGSVLGNYEAAYQLNTVSFGLLKKLEADSLKAGCYFIFANFISHWRAHFKECLDYFDMCFKSGMEIGDLYHAAFAVAFKAPVNLYVNNNLNDCRTETENTLKFLKGSKAKFVIIMSEITILAINQLQSTYDFEKESIILKELTGNQDLTFLYVFGHCCLMVNYILGNLEAADKWSAFTEQYFQAGTGFYSLPDFYMFKSLTLIKRYEKADEKAREEIIEALVKNIEKLKMWSDNCPQNFLHKYLIVRAELAGIQKEPVEKIMSLYKEALNSINPGDFTNMKALINELIGEFWIGRNEEFIARAYIKEAYYLYSQWGAFSKVQILEYKYFSYFSEFGKFNYKSSNSDLRCTRTKFTEVLSLDVGSILKSSQAISSEIKLDKLLKVLMHTIIENAGAQSGCLLLERGTDRNLFVEALKSRNDEDIHVMQSIPFNESTDFCPELIQHVIRTRESIVIDDAEQDQSCQKYEYFIKNKTKSVMCMPIIYQNDLKGIIYLENNLMGNVFTMERLETLKIISSQISISIENARLYENLEEKVRERTLQLEHANNELKELALHDPLTKLHNRRYMYEYVSSLPEEIAKSTEAACVERQIRDSDKVDDVIGVYMIDIDFFKKINDTYGHAAGDEVLIAITGALRKNIRSEDYIIRWGGEEFLIILNQTKVECLKVFSENILNIVRQTPIQLAEGKKINVTCSIGCTCLPLEPELTEVVKLEQLVNVSDLAMYKAKEMGRNRSVHINFKNLKDLGREEIKDYLMELTKSTDIDATYITIEEVI